MKIRVNFNSQIIEKLNAPHKTKMFHTKQKKIVPHILLVFETRRMFYSQKNTAQRTQSAICLA